VSLCETAKRLFGAALQPVFSTIMTALIDHMQRVCMPDSLAPAAMLPGRKGNFTTFH